MKLLKLSACLPAVSGGNVKRQTMMEDAVVDGLSDRGSTPLRSMKERSDRALALSDLSFVYLKRVVLVWSESSAFGQGPTTSSGRRFWADRSEAETDSPVESV